jgi:hypothetical protein
VLPGAELFADDLEPRDPYIDPNVLSFARGLPDRLRTGGYLQRAYLRRHPAVAAVPNTSDGLPPALTGPRRQLTALGVRVRRSRTLGSLGLSVERPGLGDYSSDLRRNGAGLLGILLEPRTLARRQVQEAAVRRLVAETLDGRGRHTMALGVLLTLELFQRQFVDGDGPPASRA